MNKKSFSFYNSSNIVMHAQKLCIRGQSPAPQSQTPCTDILLRQEGSKNRHMFFLVPPSSLYKMCHLCQNASPSSIMRVNLSRLELNHSIPSNVSSAFTKTNPYQAGGKKQTSSCAPCTEHVQRNAGTRQAHPYPARRCRRSRRRDRS